MDADIAIITPTPTGQGKRTRWIPADSRMVTLHPMKRIIPNRVTGGFHYADEEAAAGDKMADGASEYAGVTRVQDDTEENPLSDNNQDESDDDDDSDSGACRAQSLEATEPYRTVASIGNSTEATAIFSSQATVRVDSVVRTPGRPQLPRPTARTSCKPESHVDDKAMDTETEINSQADDEEIYDCTTSGDEDEYMDDYTGSDDDDGDEMDQRSEADTEMADDRTEIASQPSQASIIDASPAGQPHGPGELGPRQHKRQPMSARERYHAEDGVIMQIFNPTKELRKILWRSIPGVPEQYMPFPEDHPPPEVAHPPVRATEYRDKNDTVCIDIFETSPEIRNKIREHLMAEIWPQNDDNAEDRDKENLEPPPTHRRRSS
ncbi:predicted protein [Postia placenta Mad-698-R]|nr:predicted protein [Postia placenta Mad-698-R]